MGIDQAEPPRLLEDAAQAESIWLTIGVSYRLTRVMRTATLSRYFTGIVGFVEVAGDLAHALACARTGRSS